MYTVNLTKNSPRYWATMAAREIGRSFRDAGDRSARVARVMLGLTTIDYVHPTRVRVNLRKDSPVYRATMLTRQIARGYRDVGDRTDRAVRMLLGETTIDYTHPNRVAARV